MKFICIRHEMYILSAVSGGAQYSHRTAEFDERSGDLDFGYDVDNGKFFLVSRFSFP